MQNELLPKLLAPAALFAFFLHCCAMVAKVFYKTFAKRTVLLKATALLYYIAFEKNHDLDLFCGDPLFLPWLL
jgi:hypothetical protein